MAATHHTFQTAILMAVCTDPCGNLCGADKIVCFRIQLCEVEIKHGTVTCSTCRFVLVCYLLICVLSRLYKCTSTSSALGRLVRSAHRTAVPTVFFFFIPMTTSKIIYRKEKKACTSSEQVSRMLKKIQLSNNALKFRDMAVQPDSWNIKCSICKDLPHHTWTRA